MGCQNLSCCEESHHCTLDQLTAEVLSAMIESAWDNLKYTKATTGDQKSRKYILPGWNRFVKPYQEEAKFWFNLWSSAGKQCESSTPEVDHGLYSAMRYSRNQYIYAVRRAQKNVSFVENKKKTFR